MKYYYPENLEAPATVLLWSMKNFFIIAFSTVFSLIIASAGLLIPLVAVSLYAILTVQLEDTTTYQYSIKIGSYLLSKQQKFYWEAQKSK